MICHRIKIVNPQCKVWTFGQDSEQIFCSYLCKRTDCIPAVAMQTILIKTVCVIIQFLSMFAVLLTSVADSLQNTHLDSLVGILHNTSWCKLIKYFDAKYDFCTIIYQHQSRKKKP